MTPATAVAVASEAPTESGGGGAERRSRFRRICVYCGSAKGRKPSYQDAAIQLGNQLVERGIDLVYGGGSIGLMGSVSHAVHAGGRHVMGIIPKSLMPREVTGEPVGEVRAVSGMHERKAEMARFADAFVALPGGYGTLEELLEIITWAQLGIHKKPVGLLNVDGFYDPLLSFIDLAVNEGFITEAARRIIISAPTAKELVMKLEDYVPEYDIGLVWEEQKPNSFVRDQPLLGLMGHGPSLPKLAPVVSLPRWLKSEYKGTSNTAKGIMNQITRTLLYIYFTLPYCTVHLPLSFPVPILFLLVP